MGGSKWPSLKEVEELVRYARAVAREFPKSPMIDWISQVPVEDVDSSLDIYPLTWPHLRKLVDKDDKRPPYAPELDPKATARTDFLWSDAPPRLIKYGADKGLYPPRSPNVDYGYEAAPRKAQAHGRDSFLGQALMGVGAVAGVLLMGVGVATALWMRRAKKKTKSPSISNLIRATSTGAKDSRKVTFARKVRRASYQSFKDGKQTDLPT
eukprot:GHVT01089515.1.p1 GENE.GHVT01089515.1~~GHVT01089515.1.p1  ORF type:complete len:210 (-),score=28.58 GHVT01089515.1:1054-1683(-)